MGAVLDDHAVETWLAQHDGWRQEGSASDGGVLRRTVECASFPAAIEMVQRIAAVAEERDHHPDIDIRWRTLTFRCSTHSAGGITEKDTALAASISEQIDAAGG
jgi:4a-hydroxytetrahydrobiopterin dehydratase